MKKDLKSFFWGEQAELIIFLTAWAFFSLLVFFLPVGGKFLSTAFVVAFGVAVGYRAGEAEHDPLGVLLFVAGIVIVFFGVLFLSVNLAENSVLNTKESIFVATVFSPIVSGLGGGLIGLACKVMRCPEDKKRSKRQ